MFHFANEIKQGRRSVQQRLKARRREIKISSAARQACRETERAWSAAEEGGLAARF